MRALLVAMLLLVTVMLLYQGIAEGDEGMHGQLDHAGHSVSGHIRGMSP